ncbi:MAG: spore germination protein [Bacillaceae bacterium]|nr:spore germination protein [Bacillaceae bacterium]
MKNNEQLANLSVSTSLHKNISFVRHALNQTDDLKERKFSFQGSLGVAIFLDTLIDYEKIERKFLSRIIDTTNNSKHLKDFIVASDQSSASYIQDVSKGLIQGKVAIFLEGKDEAILFSATKDADRSIEEPSNEKIVRGSHVGFIENLNSNIQLLRKKIEHPKLTVKYYRVGKKTNTKLALVYLASLANQEIINKIDNRINHISTDMGFDPGFVEEFVEDRPISPFPQMLNTERPDRVMSNILDGKVALLSEGSPTALVFPVSFFAFYQSPDDYNSRFLVGSFYRIIRMISFFIAIFVPAFYIATVAFHFEVIPGDLILPVKNSVERVPYPPIIEALIMELTIELIREAGIRLPSPIGQTIGIVGGLVIGDAVVQAGLVSNIMIIVVAITAIASFVIPSPEMNTALRVIRFPFMFAAASFGYFGIVFCFAILLIHLCKLQTFGSPYFAPLAPFQLNDLKDSIFRAPIWKMKRRPIAPLPKEIVQEENSRGWEKDEADK